jgi:uncharacterized membrane protein
MGRLRGYFLAGLVVVAPIAITIWIAWWFVSLFDRWVKPLIPDAYNPDNYLPFTVPGVGLVFTVVVITIIGFFTANLVGRSILSWWERILERMPVLRSIYRGTKQIFTTALSQGSRNFKSVGLLEYPRKGVHVVAFIARELDSGELGLTPGSPMLACFMPTTPNPTSGFLFFVHRDEVRILDISVEDAAKLVISAGLVLPGERQGEGLIPVIENGEVVGHVPAAHAGGAAEATGGGKPADVSAHEKEGR